MSDAHLWHNGRIFTGRGYASALLVESERVVVSGTLEEVRRSAPTGTEYHDLAGDLIIPGLIDAHLHLAELVLQARGVDASGVGSVPELVERARAWAALHPAGPIVGRGWSFPHGTERDWPAREDLDRVDARRPVLLFHASGHAASVNSDALERLAIGPKTADPSGGRIGRSASGDPDGRLFETALLPATLLAHESLSAEPDAIADVTRCLLAYGITGASTMNTDASELEAIARLSVKGRLEMRIRSYLALPWFRELTDERLRALPAPSPMLRVAGVKAFADGAFGTRTAWLEEPYEDDPGTRGMPVHSLEEMVPAFERAHAHGLSAAVHALGDRGLAHALKALERASGGAPYPGDRIEHAGLVPPGLWAPLSRVRPTLVVQPVFVYTDEWLNERLGAARPRWAYPFRTLLGMGLLLAGSSDAPFDSLDPWVGIAAAVRRRSPQGRSANAELSECLTIEEALGLYTQGGAAAWNEPDLGGLAAGQRADLVRLAAPSLERALERGADAVRETWVGGRCVHRSTGGSPQTVHPPVLE